MSSKESENILKSMRMWYTAPCELVFAFSLVQVEAMPDDFARKTVQIFVVEVTNPLSREWAPFLLWMSLRVVDQCCSAFLSTKKTAARYSRSQSTKLQ